MSDKLALKDILGLIDHGARDAWKELTPQQRKQVGFWIIGRFTSTVNGSREKQELAVFKTNEYYNKNLAMIKPSTTSGHAELLWQLACMTGNTGKIEFHKWIAPKKKSGNVSSNAVNLLAKLYPAMKIEEVEQLAEMHSSEELTKLAEENGIEGFKL